MLYSASKPNVSAVSCSQHAVRLHCKNDSVIILYMKYPFAGLFSFLPTLLYTYVSGRKTKMFYVQCSKELKLAKTIKLSLENDYCNILKHSERDVKG